MQYHCSNLKTGEHQGNVHDFDCTKQKMAIKQMKTMQRRQINGSGIVGQGTVYMQGCTYSITGY